MNNSNSENTLRRLGYPPDLYCNFRVGLGSSCLQNSKVPSGDTWTCNGPNLSMLKILPGLCIGRATACVSSSLKSSPDKSRSEKRQEDTEMEMTHLRLHGKDKK